MASIFDSTGSTTHGHTYVDKLRQEKVKLARENEALRKSLDLKREENLELSHSNRYLRRSIDLQSEETLLVRQQNAAFQQLETETRQLGEELEKQAAELVKASTWKRHPGFCVIS